MKTRLDFVSNSSSSSFVMWGVMFNRTSLEQALRESGLLSDGSCLDDWLDSMLSYDDYACNSYAVVLGMSPDKMEDTETLLQFKKRILSRLSDAQLPVGDDASQVKLVTGVNNDGVIDFD